jgi:hypothetical protein|tara:strand:+ start:48 stop:275 length:228 start_codon:yes stop_codon:yes gene_type:complete
MKFTTEYFWDCECDNHYIHPKTEEKCNECGFYHHEMPDSRTEEVIMMLKGEINWAEALSYAEKHHTLDITEEKGE